MCKYSEFVKVSGQKTPIEALVFHLRKNNPDLEFHLGVDKVVHISGIQFLSDALNIVTGIDGVSVHHYYDHFYTPFHWRVEPYFVTGNGHILAKFCIDHN